jgi:chemotaxis protein methyltransferase CheR
MQNIDCRSIDSYINRLRNSEKSELECRRLLTVSISRFFRDRLVWKNIHSKILPKLFKRDDRKIKVWSAGCASGEEVYSMKIVWDRFIRYFEHPKSLEIIATDVNPICIERAIAGVYPVSSLKEVSDEIRSIYFKVKGTGNLFEIEPSLKHDIVWKIHDLLFDPPGSHFHMIFLRNNLLTYYEEEVRAEALKKITNNLSEHGFLIIGSHEDLPDGNLHLSPFAPSIFLKQKADVVL